MKKDCFVVLRRAYSGSDEPSKWESIGYFDSYQEANDSLDVGSGKAVKPEYNVGDLFTTINIDYISDIENTESFVFILSNEMKIEFTLHCYALGSKSWFSGWEGVEADPYRMIDTAIKASVPTTEIANILAECLLASISMQPWEDFGCSKYLAEELFSVTSGNPVNSSLWNKYADKYQNEPANRIRIAATSIYERARELRPTGGYAHPLVSCVYLVLSSMRGIHNENQVMVDIINRRIPLSRLLLMSR